MKANNILLDRNILAHFDGIFRAMDISDAQIVNVIQDIDLPPLDIITRNELSTDGTFATENFADEWIELAEPQLFFKYKKRVVIMYQRDQFLTAENYAQRRWRPYHLCFCKALRDAHEKNRYESRYVMTYNTSGKFKVNLFVRDKYPNGSVYTQKKEQDIYLPLKVCQHCLRELNWKNFRSYCGGGLEWWRGGDSQKRNRIVYEFNLEEYLSTARQEDNFFDHPVFGTASSTIEKKYVLSPQIKEYLKRIVDYTCEICGEKFPAYELQIHHKNHNEGDNRRQNLMVVCADCHSLIHEAEGGFMNRRKKISTSANFQVNSSDGKKYRVHELAKAFNRDSQVIIDLLNKHNFNVTSHLSTVDEAAYNIVAETFRRLNPAEYAAAQIKLGDMYRNGWGVPKDLAKAKAFYRKAFDVYKVLAANGNTDALYYIGKYAEIFGIPKYDFKRVFEKYRAQAEGGDVKAKIRIGLMYAKGQGVNRDVYAAKKILASLTKDVKFVDGELVELRMLTGNIDGALKFHAKAAQLFEVAANNGYTDAAFELAKLYFNKNFVGEDYEGVVGKDYDDEATKLFKESAEFYAAQADAYERTDPYLIQKAKDGDPLAILELKRLAREGKSDAQAALESLYYDGNREHAVGTVVLREDVTKLEERFWHCDNLKTIVLPDDLIFIPNMAFCNCDNLTTVVFPRNLMGIDGGNFENVSHVIYHEDIEPLLKNYFGIRWGRIEKTAIGDDESAPALDRITSNLSYISYNYIFDYYNSYPGSVFTRSSVETVILTKHIKAIGNGAFKDCKSLKTVILSENLTEIDRYAFCGCERLPNIILPNKLKSIGDSAFMYCPFKTLTFPESLTYIGYRAFEGCKIEAIAYHKKTESLLRNCFGASVWDGLTKTVIN